MAARITITADPRNHRHAQILRERSEVRAQRTVYRAALRKAAVPMGRGVYTDMGQYMPHGGGYLGVLTGSLKTRYDVEQGIAAVTIKDSAKGKSHARDVRSLQKGRLRHPVYGRRTGRRGQSIMSDTRITPGFFTRPITARAEEGVKAIVEAMRDLARQMTSG